MSRLTIGPYATGNAMAATDMNSILDSVNALYDNPDLQGVLEFDEISIVHTNGVADNYAGVASPISSSTGAGTSGGNLTLTPGPEYWKSLNVNVRAISMGVHSNVVVADLTGSGSGNAVLVKLVQAFLSGASTATSGQRMIVDMRSDGNVLGSDGTSIGGAMQKGTLSTPPEVDESATLYGVDANTVGGVTVYAIGVGGNYSRAYFTFAITIPASAASKTYKFKIYLRYQ